MKRLRAEELPSGRDVAADHAIYLPPWRVRLGSGELGPAYGPITESEFVRRQREHEQSIYGGGLWDPAEDCGREERRQRMVAERYDGERMRRFVERHSADIPRRELEVYVAWYVDGLSYARTASRMGIAKSTAIDLVRRLRDRERHYARHATGSTQ